MVILYKACIRAILRYAKHLRLTNTKHIAAHINPVKNKGIKYHKPDLCKKANIRADIIIEIQPAYL